MTARGQATLLGFAAAVVVVAAVTVTGVVVADDALADADRQPRATHAADRLATHLVAADAAHTRERNVLRADRTVNLTAADLASAVPPVRGRSLSVALDGDTIVERGVATDSAVHIERRVRVERAVDRTRRVDLTARNAVTLADHTGRVVVRIDTERTRTVHTVRADGRVVLHDPSGLSGRYVVAVPETRPLTVGFESDGDGPGTVRVSWTATNASVGELVVTVGE
ncbi:DUF7263 family protein [Halobellus ruber]|uniref:Uncharacterized protein n=1 Tax=Halobellus ruber TaxID=2761102 RepID=A0A7J9SN80_9EURY|nr:hypothetical protein [Halobellus ruber]MBB6647537.1 hypothetical protein [Halobellus ruber]